MLEVSKTAEGGLDDLFRLVSRDDASNNHDNLVSRGVCLLPVGERCGPASAMSTPMERRCLYPIGVPEERLGRLSTAAALRS